MGKKSSAQFAEEILGGLHASEAGISYEAIASALLLEEADENACSYSDVEALLVCYTDHLAGIKTRKLTTESALRAHNLKAEDYPTGKVYFRNACDEDFLKKRVPATDARYAQTDLLLRCLNTARGIDYAFAQLEEKTANVRGKRYYQQLRTALKKWYGGLLKNFSSLSTSSDIDTIERSFNAGLCQFLHAGSLDLGLNDGDNVKDISPASAAKAYSKLLVYYRFLSGTINPAAAMVTVYQAGAGVTVTEASVPVTEKTAPQKDALKQILKSPVGKRNYFAVQSFPIKFAQRLFYGRLSADDSQLGAQLRKTLAPCLKNAYVNRLRVEFNPEETFNYSFCHSAALTYMGNGETEASRKTHTEENIAQMQAFAKKQGYQAEEEAPHITCLNTYAPYNKEHRIYTETKAAARASDTVFNYVPLNVDGTFRLPEIASDIGPIVGRRVQGFFKSARAWFSGSVIDAIARLDGAFAWFHCASGQDRTNTTAEAAKARLLQAAFASAGKTLSDKEAIALRQVPLTGPFNATLTNPGSRGLKPGYWLGSRPGDLFGSGRQNAFYLKTARTSKHAPVDAGYAYNLMQQQERSYHLNFNGKDNCFSLHFDILKHVKRKFELYKEKRTGFFAAGLFGSKALLAFKKSQADAFLSEDMDAKNISGLLQTLEAVQAALSEKLDEVNQSKWFSWTRHGAGLFDEQLACSLKLVREKKDLQDGVLPVTQANTLRT